MHSGWEALHHGGWVAAYKQWLKGWGILSTFLPLTFWYASGAMLPINGLAPHFPSSSWPYHLQEWTHGTQCPANQKLLPASPCILNNTAGTMWFLATWKTSKTSLLWRSHRKQHVSPPVFFLHRKSESLSAALMNHPFSHGYGTVPLTAFLVQCASRHNASSDFYCRWCSNYTYQPKFQLL